MIILQQEFIQLPEEEKIARENLATDLTRSFERINDGLDMSIEQVRNRRNIDNTPALMTILPSIDIPRLMHIALKDGFETVGGEISKIGTAVFKYNEEQPGDNFSVGEKVFGEIVYHTLKNKFESESEEDEDEIFVVIEERLLNLSKSNYFGFPFPVLKAILDKDRIELFTSLGRFLRLTRNKASHGREIDPGFLWAFAEDIFPLLKDPILYLVENPETILEYINLDINTR